MTRRIHVIGIGAGSADYVTTQAISALNDTDVFFVMDKGPDKAGATRELMAWRRDICSRFINNDKQYRFVELPDPKRDPSGDYTTAVAEWHAGRAKLCAEAIVSELRPDGVGAFLAWGDPSLYDSTLRIVDAVASFVDIEYDVIPGITAVQALTARHRLPLNDIGEPVLITTGRKLDPEFSGTVVVMLDADCAFQKCPPGTQIWWGAYLGTEHELLASGTVGEVGKQIVSTRADARARRGWIMDTYLLRSTD